MSHPETVGVSVRPDRGTWRFRRNCRIAVEAGALVATDRKKRTVRFPLDGSNGAPTTYRKVVGWPLGTDPPPNWSEADCVIDSDGNSVVVIANPTRWPSRTEVFEAANLAFDPYQEARPLRVDGIRLEDARWAEPRYLFAAVTSAQVIASLGKLGVVDLFPWIIVIVLLLVYGLAALFSGRYFDLRAKKNDERVARRPRGAPGRRRRTKVKRQKRARG